MFGGNKTDAATPGGFSFPTPNAGGAGDAKAAETPKPLNFGLPQAQTGGFNFALPKTTGAAPTGFTLPSSTTPANILGGSSAPGTPTSTLGGALNLTTLNVQASLPSGGFNFQSTPTSSTFGVPNAAAPKLGAFGTGTTGNLSLFGAQPAPNATNTGTFGVPQSMASLGKGVGNLATGLSMAQAPSLAQVAPTPTLTPTSSLATGANLATATAASLASGNLGGGVTLTPTSGSLAGSLGQGNLGAAAGFKLPGATTVTSATSFNLGTAAQTTASTAQSATSTAPTLNFGAVSAATSLTAPKTQASTTGFSLPTSTLATTSTTAITSALPASGTLTFSQLEDSINKWTIDLEEQGKLFGNQAKQLNAWDRLLVANGEKVLALNNGIERVKQQQTQLDQELDFVLAQQKELEDLITPLEKELNDVPVTDMDRHQTYQLAENIDTQLKQMSEDLKEIIEQLNETNKSQENSNPITQIRKILNAHMNSLQWIDSNTSKITTHLDQISKVHDLHRKNHENTLKKNYD